MSESKVPEALQMLIKQMEPYARAMGWDMLILGDPKGKTMGLAFVDAKSADSAAARKCLRFAGAIHLQSPKGP